MKLGKFVFLCINTISVFIGAVPETKAVERPQNTPSAWEEAFPHFVDESEAIAVGLVQIGAAYLETGLAFGIQLDRLHQERMADIYRVSLEQRLRSRRLPTRLVHRFKAPPYLLLADGALRFVVLHSNVRNPGISPAINLSSVAAKRAHGRLQAPPNDADALAHRRAE